MGKVLKLAEDFVLWLSKKLECLEEGKFIHGHLSETGIPLAEL